MKTFTRLSRALVVLILVPLPGLLAQEGTLTVGAIPDVTLGAGQTSASAAQMADVVSVEGVSGQVVKFDTARGDIFVEMLSDDAPATVANFLRYVDDGDYNDTFFHRAIAGFVIQGGGFAFPVVGPTPVPTDDPVVNEFKLSNLRGTLSMAKLGGDPDSATNQFFINLADNSANLDAQNGGFTVFAEVIGGGMSVADEIAAMPKVNLGGAFTDLPISASYSDSDKSVPPEPEDTAAVNSVTRVPLVGEGGYATVIATSSNPNRVRAKIENGAIVVEGVETSGWTETITVTATDPAKQSASTTFSVTSTGDGQNTDGGDQNTGDQNTDDGSGSNTDQNNTDQNNTNTNTDGGTTDDNTSGVTGTLFSDAIPVGGGWEYSDWFGFYFPDSGGTSRWIHQEHMGWLYTIDNGDGSAWCWHPFFQWIWTDGDSYPWFYRADRSWTYMDLADPGAQLFYDSQEDFWFNYFPEG